MKVVRLGEICKVVSGSTPKREISEYWNGSIPWVTPKEIGRLPSRFLWESVEKITEAGFRSCSTAMLPAGSLLLSSRAPIGLLAINKLSVCTNQGFKSLIPSKAVDVEYLYFVLKAKVSSLQAVGNGATFKELAKPSVENFEIPLPPLDDQIRIAQLLGKVEGLISQRKQHLHQLDELLKSVFLEMFGDPVRNEKGWEKKPCNEVAEIITGHPFKSDLYTDDPTQIRLCGGLIIYPHVIEWTKCNYWPKKLLLGLEKYLLEANDVVLAMDRPWISSGLKICTVDAFGPGSLLVQRTARLRATEVEQYFLYAHLKDSSFTRHCKPTETTVPHISIKDIQTFQVLCPPKKLQTKFAQIAKKIEILKSRYQRSLTDLEALYSALSQQAFKGELDLSRVPLPEAHAAAPQPVVSNHEALQATTVQVMHLPDTDLLLAALGNRERVKELLQFWLSAHCSQMDSSPFSAQGFMAAAQTRVAELHPDTDFELGSSDYEHIKAWVFDALAAAQLTQAFDGDNNHLLLKAGHV
jgi:type I restriction enzyme, S subunit